MKLDDINSEFHELAGYFYHKLFKKNYRIIIYKIDNLGFNLITLKYIKISFFKEMLTQENKNFNPNKINYIKIILRY